MSEKPVLLQICQFQDFLERGLAERFHIVKWHQTSNSAAWLADHADKIRAIATSATVGVSTELMACLPALEIIAIYGVGFECVDLEAARRRNVRVSYTPDVLTDDVADLAVGLTIALLRRITSAERFVREGHWASGSTIALSRRVSGSRFGIVGLGRIGLAIAARLSPFGPISYTATSEKPAPYRFEPDLTELARWSDVLIVSALANSKTRHLIDSKIIDALGPQGYLVNISRGALVDEPALIAALTEGRIAGAALDVFANEPNVPAELRQLPNVVLTPHVASATSETRHAMAQLVLDNLDAHFAGTALPSQLV